MKHPPSACDAIRDDLVALLAARAGDATALDPARAAAVDAHLAACAACARERDLLVAAWLGLDRVPGLEARPAWLAGVEAAILAADAVEVRPAKETAHQRPALKVHAGGAAQARSGGAAPAARAVPVPPPGGSLRWLAAAAVFALAVGLGWWAARPDAPRAPVAVTERRPAPPRTTSSPPPPGPTEQAPVAAPPVDEDAFVSDLDVVLALAGHLPDDASAPPPSDEDLVREAVERLAQDAALRDLDPEEVDDA